MIQQYSVFDKDGTNNSVKRGRKSKTTKFLCIDMDENDMTMMSNIELMVMIQYLLITKIQLLSIVFVDTNNTIWTMPTMMGMMTA